MNIGSIVGAFCGIVAIVLAGYLFWDGAMKIGAAKKAKDEERIGKMLGALIDITLGFIVFGALVLFVIYALAIGLFGEGACNNGLVVLARELFAQVKIILPPCQ